MPGFESATKYKLIYVFAIHDDTHAGLLKVGEATIKTTADPATLVPGCSALNKAAKSRIDSYTATAGISYQLLYTELALKVKQSSMGTILSNFSDKDVHTVLLHSGRHQIKPNATDGNEWFDADLDTIKNAIAAVKEGRTSLTSTEIAVTTPKIIFREEQEDAVVKTLECFKKDNEMLWYAKMRFGKTLTSLEVVRRAEFRRVIIATHRPVVGGGWEEDFHKIFRAGEDPHNYTFVFKSTAANNADYDAAIDQQNDMNLHNMDSNGLYFVYFASIQDLRGSKRVGGIYEKNNAVFDMPWDLIIIDEAHEGTQTELGGSVIKALRKDDTKVLSLSGTPFNILDQYNEENVYTWDYVMEQRRKAEWDLTHPGDHNPYADLPQMHIYTYDLGDEIPGYVEYELEGKAFNFREFFRTWTGNPDWDKRPAPVDVSVGDFFHEDAVHSFLNLITTESEKSLYPYSTKEYRDMFKHTLWMVPGVKEARALSELLREHPVFKHFGIANVAGEGDDYEDTHNKEALQLVRDTIANNEYSITLSCGKLTTGVTVKEWTAVFMLSGSYSTAAAGYMQTIFRVQSAGEINGQQKTDCYVFDFAPDRTLKVLAETAKISRKAGKAGKQQESNRDAMSDFINFCPVIAISGTEMKPYSVNTMMEQLKRVYAEKAIRNGFDDASIYNDNLMRLDNLELEMFKKLKGVVGSGKAAPPLNDVEINAQGFTEEEHEQAEKARKKPKRQLTPEEIELLKKLQEQRKNRDNAISILRGVSIRMPLLIYGADVPLDEDIDIEHFVDMVDETSWKEFMPNGVTKALFHNFLKYYDRDVFISAGKEIRKLAASADQLTPTQRVAAVARIFRYFKNPDKETVLTPWRVVNMHMSDIMGGWCFYDEAFEHELEEPRFVDRGKVTADVLNNAKAQVLEINSKSGLYPLYVSYSIYRAKLEGTGESEWTLEELLQFWNDTIRENVFVVCKTPMAKCITQRTLAGYTGAFINAHYFNDLVNMLRNKPEQFRKKISRGRYWNREVRKMEFDAIVGNPPYQVMDGGSKASATPLYNYFVEQAKEIAPKYLSMIMPAKWFSGGRGLDQFRDNMLHDDRTSKLIDYADANVCFPGVDIAGGICYFLWDKCYHGTCEFTNIHQSEVVTHKRALDCNGPFVRYNKALSITEKVAAFGEDNLSSHVSSQKPFGLRTYVKPEKTGDLVLRFNGGKGPFPREKVEVGIEWIDKWKVIMSYLTYDHAGLPDKDGKRRIFSTMEVLPPATICTETYLLVDVFESEEEARNLLIYLKTKFARFLVSQIATTQHISKSSFGMLPVQDFTKVWDDSALYEKYGLTQDEIKFIDSMIKPME